MEAAYFKQFRFPSFESEKANLEALRKTYLPSILQYSFLNHPIYEITLHTIEPCDIMVVSICHRTEKRVAMHSLPLLVAPSTIHEKLLHQQDVKQEWITTSFPKKVKVFRKSQSIQIEDLRLYWCTEQRTFVIEERKENIRRRRKHLWRQAMRSLSILQTDAEFALCCLPSNSSHDMQVHFMLSMHYAAASSNSSFAETNFRKGDKQTLSFLLASMVSEWYLQFHADMQPSRNTPMGQTIHQPQSLIHPIGSQLASEFSTIWSEMVLPRLETMFRSSTVIQSEVAGSSMIARLVEVCWQTYCLPKLQPVISRFHTAWTNVQTTSCIHHRIFERVSEGLSRDQYSELNRLLRLIGGKNMHTCPTYSLEEHLDPEHSFQIWMDGSPWGYWIHERNSPSFHALFQEKVRRQLGLSGSFISLHLDWIRKRISLWTIPGRLGIWMRTNGREIDEVETANFTFHELIQQGKVEWIDYATEIMHVELNKTHFHVNNRLFRSTWYDLMFDVSLKWRSPHNEMSSSLTAALASIHPLDCEVSGKRCKNIVQGHGPLIDAYQFNCVDRNQVRSREVTVAVGLYDSVVLGNERNEAVSRIVLNASSVQRGLFANTLFHVHEIELNPKQC